MNSKKFWIVNKDEFKILNNTFVWPHIEFSIQAWSPYLEKVIACLESAKKSD